MALYGKQRISGRNRELPPAAGKELTAVRVWASMIHLCHDKEHKRTHDDRKIVSSRFKDFHTFHAWFLMQPCSNRDDVILNKDLLIPNSRVYSDVTCCLLPKQVSDVLDECRINRSDLEALQAEFGSSVLASGENAVEGAYNAAKAEMEASLRLLAEKHRAELDPRVYRALIMYKVTIVD